MHSSDIRHLQPFVDHIQRDHRVLIAALTLVEEDPSRCSCGQDDAGRWTFAGTCAQTPPPADQVCLTIAHLALRRQLASMKIPTDHLTDDQLAGALDDLHALTLQLADLTRDGFVAGMQTALHAGDQHGETEATGAR